MILNVYPIFVGVLSLVALKSIYGSSVSQIEGMKVSNSNGVLHCDQIECPEGSKRCHASKENFEDNLRKLKRENICYDADDKVLKLKSWTEHNEAKKVVKVHIDMDMDGRTCITNTDPGTAKDIDNRVSQIYDEVASMLRNVGSFFSSWDMWSCF